MFMASPFPARPAILGVEESRAARRAKSGDRVAALVAPSIVQLSLRAGSALLEDFPPLETFFGSPGHASPTLAPELSLPDSILPCPVQLFLAGASAGWPWTAKATSGLPPQPAAACEPEHPISRMAR